MHLFGILAIACLIVLTTGQKPSHGKVVVCPLITQSILDTFLSEFNIDNAEWNLCTHLVVIDNQFVGLEGNLNEILIFFFTEYLNVCLNVNHSHN